MADLSQYSNEDLIGMLGGGGSPTPAPSNDISSIPTESLIAMLGQAPMPSSDSLLGGQNASPSYKAGRIAAGGISQAIPFGDVITAGGASTIDDLKGFFTGADPANSYDQRLQEIRDYQDAFNQKGKELSKEYLGDNFASKAIGYIPDAAVNAPKVFAPIGSLASKAPTALTRIAASVPEGAAIGAAYGFESGRGQEDRIAGAEFGAKAGALISPAASTIGELLSGGSKGLTNLADEVMPPTAEEKTIQSLGITRADYGKANKFAKTATAEENPLVKSIDLAKSKGVFAGNPDPEAILSRNSAEIDKLGNQVTSILKEADNAQTDVPELVLSKVQQHLAENPFQEKELAAQLQRRLQVIDSAWDGTISGLNKVKQKIGKIAYKGTTDSQALDKALYTDLKNTIEKSAEQYGGSGLGEQVRSLNQEIGSHINLIPIVDKAKNKALAATTAAPKGGSLEKLYNTAAIAELAVSHSPYLFATKAAYNAANTDIGRKGISKAIGESAKLSKGLAGLLNSKEVQRAAIFGTSRHGMPTENKKQEKLPTTPKSSQNLQNDTSGTSIAPKAKNISLNLGTKGSGNQPQKITLNKVLDVVEKVESNGNPRAVSKAGAKGAYQFTDATAKDYGLKNPFDRNESRKAASRKLTDDYGKFGQLELALAAYNYGAGAVSKKLKQHNGDDYSDIEAYLPKETRDYVKKIAAALRG